MRMLGRLFLIALALPFAVAAGILTLAVVAVFDPVMAGLAGTALQAGLEMVFDAFDSLDDPGLLLDGAAYGLGRVAFTVLVLPVAFVALVCEVAGARSLVWHAGGTALVTAALPWLAGGAAGRPTPEEAHVAAMLALVGAAAGFVYWLIAGQGAGGRAHVSSPQGEGDRSKSGGGGERASDRR